MSGTMDEAAALQTTLAGEHATVWVLGLLGARTSQSSESALYDAIRAAYAVHRDRRDSLIAAVAALGQTPVGAAAAYTPPTGLETEAGRAAAALALERACATTYAALVGSVAAERRAEAIAWLGDAAVRELSFRGTPEMFPGADELADR